MSFRTHLLRTCQFLLLASALILGGCSPFDPSKWDSAKMSNEVVEQWKLVDVQLTPVAGGFEGTGKDSQGESFKIKITTDPATKSASGTGSGDRGTELTFSVKPK